jgi:site-specific DNA recombinase
MPLDPEFMTSHASSPKRAALYARYSSNVQDPCSIDDQVRDSREAVAQKGWVVLDEFIYSDEAKYGWSLQGREGLGKLLELARQKPRPFDVIVIDDTSRFGRNLSITLPICDELEYLGVALYFAKQELGSWNPHFRDLFLKEGRQDEQFSVGLGQKVKRGQRGRVARGYVGAGRTYGYDLVPDEILGSKGLHGRPKVAGVNLVVNSAQAVVIERMFKMRAAGISQLQIAQTFNREGIPSSLSDSTKTRRVWRVGTITRHLNNEKYVGVYVYNKRKQIRNPKTGRKELIPRPINEWVIEYWPEIRIVSNDLWVAVQKELTNASGKLVGRRKGGLNRTEASRGYIFSGHLECSSCSGKINIVHGGKYAVYGCHRHRFEGTCTNGLAISRRSLESQLLAYLANALKSPELEDNLANEFTRQLKAECAKRTKLAEEHAMNPGDIERRRATLSKQITNLLDTAQQFGPSAELKVRYDGLKRELDSLKPPPPVGNTSVSFTPKQISEFLNKKLNDLASVLAGDPELAKREIQKRLTKLLLTPIETLEGRGYEVSGDLRLFSGPDDVMLDQFPHKLDQHYTESSMPIRVRLACERRPKMTMAA